MGTPFFQYLGFGVVVSTPAYSNGWDEVFVGDLLTILILQFILPQNGRWWLRFNKFVQLSVCPNKYLDMHRDEIGINKVT